MAAPCEFAIEMLHAIQYKHVQLLISYNMSLCLFEFDRGNPIYFDGETVRATVTLKTTKEKACKKVYVEFKGEAKVRWNHTSKADKSNGYFGHEIYLNNIQTLHAKCVLPPGTHTYNYDLILPGNLPSSCIGKHGQIIYEISLVIDRPFRFNNVFRRPLTILENVNLNLNRELLLPLHGEDIKYIWGWGRKTGKIISTLFIPFGGFAPGQSIPYKLHIDNRSDGHDLIGARLRLVQTFTFRASKPFAKKNKTTEKISKTKHDETVLRLSKRNFEGVLCIPAVPPSSQLKTIVSVQYHIEVSIKTGSCHRDSKFVVPILLGTVPLFESLPDSEQALVSQPPITDGPSASSFSTPSNQPPSYDKIYPPRYERNTSVTDHFVDTEIDPHHGVESYLPRYPMYNDFKIPRV